MKYVLAYDVGTTGVKTCLFSVDKEITLVKSAQMGYGLYILPGGGAEQEAGEWWKAMVETTRKVFADCPSHRTRWRASPSAPRCRGWCWWTRRASLFAAP